MNTDLINHFTNLTLYYQLAEEMLAGDKEAGQMKGRLITFSNALKVIENTKFEIQSGKQIKGPGIAQGVINEIDEFLRSNETTRLNELKLRFAEQGIIAEIREIYDIEPNLAIEFYNEGFRDIEEILAAKPVILLFKSFYGIGFRKAFNFYHLGYRTLADLWYKANLTDAMKQAIIWRKHLSQRIPRNEMIEIDHLFNKLLSNHVIAGSYRRGAESSGDIDLLIEDTNINEIVNILEPYLVATLALKEEFKGIFRLSEDHVARRIDITIVNNMSFALLHATGSDQFNKLMRMRAIELGYKLSQYDLEGYEGEINDERDIFEALGVEYLRPEERNDGVRLEYIF